jgi:hypothetical protein
MKTLRHTLKIDIGKFEKTEDEKYNSSLCDALFITKISFEDSPQMSMYSIDARHETQLSIWDRLQVALYICDDINQNKLGTEKNQEAARAMGIAFRETMRLKL